MATLSVQQLIVYAQNAGFSGQSLQDIVAIALAESGGNTQAYNPNDPYGGSYGVLQINGAHFIPSSSKYQSGTTQACALDPQCAFDYAYKLSGGGQNFSAWGTYTSGAYKKYTKQVSDTITNALNAVGNAIVSVTGGGAGGTPSGGTTYSTDVCQTPIIGGLICSGFFEQAVIVLVGLIIGVIALVALAAPEAEKIVAGGKE